MRRTVHVFSDYACPWCYLGVARLRQAVRGRGVDIVLLPFPLSPDTPEEGRALKPYLEARGMDLDAARARLAPLLDEVGLPWNNGEDPHGYNTGRAQELAMWTAHHAPDRLDALHTVLFRRVQVDEDNVWSLDVLENAAREAGLDAVAARQAVANGHHRDEVRAWWARAREIGVTGVPTFIAEGRAVVGAQPVATLEALIEHT